MTTGPSPSPGNHKDENDCYDDWPVPLRRLCHLYGSAAVHIEGLAVLGYPPVWAATATEFRKVYLALETKQKEESQWDGS